MVAIIVVANNYVVLTIAYTETVHVSWMWASVCVFLTKPKLIYEGWLACTNYVLFTPFLTSPLSPERSKSHKTSDKESTDCVKQKSKSELKYNILRLCYVFTCLAPKVPAKKSSPLKKRASRKIPDKEDADQEMPKSKSK